MGYMAELSDAQVMSELDHFEATLGDLCSGGRDAPETTAWSWYR